MRAFVAVEIPNAPALGERRSAPEHLTLRFLEEVAAPTVDRLIASLGPAVARVPPFVCVLDGVGAFPSRARPRVVWRGVATGAAELEVLAGAVRAAVVAAGLPDDPRPFVPHVTLFRVRSGPDRDAAERLLSGAVAAPPPQPVPVDHVALVESRLTPPGAVHHVLRRFPLGGGPP
jgi:RNA 2',3'-cyclic 3'-phosphodiesterase